MTTHEFDPTVEAQLDDEQIRNDLAVALSNPTLAAANARIVYDEMVDRLMPVVADVIAAAEQRGVQRFIAQTAAQDRPDSLVLFFAGRDHGIAEASAPVLTLCDSADLGDCDGLAGAVRTADLREAIDLPLVTTVFDRLQSAAYREGYADCEEGKQLRDPYQDQDNDR